MIAPYEDIFIRDHWSAMTDSPWWAPYSRDVRMQRAWRTDALNALPQDWFDIGAHPLWDAACTGSIEQVNGEVWMIDASGRRTRLHGPSVSGEAELRASLQVRPPCPATRAEVDRCLPEPCDRQGAPDHQDGAARYGPLADLYDERMPYARVNAPLWDCFGLWGYEHTLTLVHDEPSLLAYACDRLLRRAQRTVADQAAAGAQLIWIEDCMTDSLSPADYQALNLPTLRALIRTIHELGLFSVHYATGRLTDRWELVLSTGATALALEESRKGFVHDIVEIADRIEGRMALFGNLDAHQLERASLDALRIAIDRQFQAAARNHNRFIVSLGSPVTPGTSIARIRAWRELVSEAQAVFGRHPK